MSRSTSTSSPRAASRRPARSIFPRVRPTLRRRSPTSPASRRSIRAASPSSASPRAPMSRWRSPPRRRPPLTPRAAAAYYPPCANRQGEALQIPTLILIGEADSVTPAADCRAFVAAQPPGEARLVVLPGAGHLFDDSASAGGREVLGMHFIYDRVATARAREELRRFLAANLSRSRPWRLTAARGCESFPAASPATRFSSSFRHGFGRPVLATRPEGGTRRSACSDVNS